MKGNVLGYDAAAGTGAITGDDGKRYTFVSADNRGTAALKAGDAVDFQVEADAAKDIYAVPAAASLDLSAMAANPAVANILAKPYVLWAGVIILGSLIAGYLGTLEALGNITGDFGSGLGLSAIFIAALFAIPVLAGVLVFFELTSNKMVGQLRIITAVAAVAGPILLPIIAGMLAPEGLRQIRELGEAFGAAGRMGFLQFVGFGISLGMLITIAGGVLIILTERGIVKLPTKL